LLRVVAVEYHQVHDVTEPPDRETGAAVISVVPDPDHRRPGRGAHLHPEPGCLAQAVRRRAFGRALRVTGNTDTAPLVEYVTSISDTTVGGDHPPRTSKVGRPT